MMPSTAKKPPLYRFAFRLPKELYEAIQELAQAETRPTNSQMIVLLREALAHRDKLPRTKMPA